MRLLQISFLSLLLLYVGSFSATAQRLYTPVDANYKYLAERYEILSGSFQPRLQSSAQPLERKALAQMADSLLLSEDNWSRADKFNLTYLQIDNHEWSEGNAAEARRPIWKIFFEKKSDLYHYRDKDFELVIRPVLDVRLGREQGRDQWLYTNTRGVELRGSIGRRVSFYSYVTDTQAELPGYVNERIARQGAMPGEGYFKQKPGETKVDFLTARGYLTFDILPNLIDLQFGHDKLFIGNGYRSLALSDNAANYTFLRLNTQAWKFKYQSIFAQMTAEAFNADGFYPQKFMVMHHLSFDLTPKLNIGVYEQVILSRADTTNLTNGRGSGGIDLAYLNPVIFYRFVEQQLGSPDNVGVGLDFRWNLWKRLQLYGQVYLGELVVSELRSNRGWRGNKYALQGGLKYINVAGIRNLDLQLEANMARPYTYSHNFTYREHSHYQQELAHPLGANFYEGIAIVRYQPLPRLQLQAKAFIARQGIDGPDGNNWGSDIFRNNGDFVQEFGNTLTQGFERRWLMAQLTASYQVRHNLFVDLVQVIRRNDVPDLSIADRTNFSSMAIRWNMPQRQAAF
jgi:hypothetical protein